MLTEYVIIREHRQEIIASTFTATSGTRSCVTCDDPRILDLFSARASRAKYINCKQKIVDLDSILKTSTSVMCARPLGAPRPPRQVTSLRSLRPDQQLDHLKLRHRVWHPLAPDHFLSLRKQPLPCHFVLARRGWSTLEGLLMDSAF